MTRENVTHIGVNIIKPSAYIDGQGILIIGPNSCIQHECWIELHTHNFDVDEWPDNDSPHTLIINAHVHIGVRTVVLGGCRWIAEGVVIGAGSVVTKDILESWTKWAGNPVRKIGRRKIVNTNFENVRGW